MKLTYLLTISTATVLALGPFVPLANAEDPDKTAVMNELERREQNLQKLSVEDQLKVRGAQQKALEDAEVKAALENRDKALADFRAKLRAAMIVADPSVKPILDKIAEGADPGVAFGR